MPNLKKKKAILKGKVKFPLQKGDMPFFIFRIKSVLAITLTMKWPL